MMMARIAEDSDFQALKTLVDDMDGWSLELEKPDAKVWTRPVKGCNFDMVKIISPFENVTADILFDVLHDPDYRRIWDSHMLASEEIGIFNVNNDVGYYASNFISHLGIKHWIEYFFYFSSVMSSAFETKRFCPAKIMVGHWTRWRTAAVVEICGA
jgi:hypothetical protein